MTESDVALFRGVEAAYSARLTALELPDRADEWRRFASGLALTSVYGLALGARSGGTSLLRHALGAPAALLAVSALAVPALFVVLALIDAPVTLPKTLSATARASASTGLLLAGLAPASALLVVTIDSDQVASVVTRLTLILAGTLGGLPLLSGIYEEVRRAPTGTRLKSVLLLCGFALFAGALSARIWSALLPILGGA
jgi:hypothetical protein